MTTADASSSTAMSPRSPLSLTLIAALSPTNGLGKAGGLPWSLSKEMAYFRKATSHVPGPSSSSASSPSSSFPSTGALSTGNTAQNVVIMGRNTWESIPPKFRPLKGRVNYVVSRTAGDKKREEELGIEEGKGSYCVASLQAALEHVQSKDIADAGRVFLIGGAQLYAQAMKELGPSSSHSSSATPAKLDRLLITRLVSPNFDCDVFLPEYRTKQQIQDDASIAGSEADPAATGGEDKQQQQPLNVAEWEKCGSTELCEWLGREVANV
ncbi:hypothetical protein BDZ90DRAFT_1057 [Jaminaea rosea]|uniref:Dihydrofolate reductase n=1 Tax=Jaminaea rosea TaxID=1569628 RepID=A0A316UX77_9BASI|nr:hypothetical protein BDZ90DRAFT_1057 [Jaminaea rosea]PWN29927.1 hypothetical protein BDZ90DRAFT_1057 [Jaminaea rosea]